MPAQGFQGQGPVHCPGIQVAKVQAARHPLRHGALTRAGGSVDGDDHIFQSRSSLIGYENIIEPQEAPLKTSFDRIGYLSLCHVPPRQV
jgi:hypothetical protein